jgi:putative SOS response-associated peptidase YedK
MCSEFILFTKAKHFVDNFGLEKPEQDAFDLRVRGYMKTDLAPVIFVNEKGKLELRQMCFSLCPTWSKNFPCDFSTYNARMERPKAKGAPGEIERIYQVPTWREPFSKGQTCLVPMNSAIESSYFGHCAGNIVRFKQKDNEVYFVAGLWSQYVEKLTGEIHDTFTLITDDPYRFFYENGHDRSVFVINDKAYETWLFEKNMKPEKRFDFLRLNRTNLDWAVDVDRKMKDGWQKRAPEAKEINNMRVWQF